MERTSTRRPGGGATSTNSPCVTRRLKQGGEWLWGARGLPATQRPTMPWRARQVSSCDFGAPQQARATPRRRSYCTNVAVSPSCPIHTADILAYSAPGSLPRGLRQNKISVDKTHDAVLLPLFGTLVPFHVSMVKSVSMTAEGRKTFLRINFHSPGQVTGKDVAPAAATALAKHRQAAFIRTLSFMSRNRANMEVVASAIKAMQKRAASAMEEKAARASLVAQPRLIIAADAKVPRLFDLHMWPAISGRKSQGTLEAHTNGLRFVSCKGERVEIMYGNVKHAIFQPCDKEHLVLIHFHLKHAIMIGKRKHRDLQFYTEVVSSSTAVDTRRSEFDADELQEEVRMHGRTSCTRRRIPSCSVALPHPAASAPTTGPPASTKNTRCRQCHRRDARQRPCHVPSPRV